MDMPTNKITDILSRLLSQAPQALTKSASQRLGNGLTLVIEQVVENQVRKTLLMIGRENIYPSSLEWKTVERALPASWMVYGDVQQQVRGTQRYLCAPIARTFGEVTQ
jgi:hypothetical protein